MKRDTHRRSFVGCGGGGGGGGDDGEVSGAKLNGDTVVLISIGNRTDGVACFSDGRYRWCCVSVIGFRLRLG